MDKYMNTKKKKKKRTTTTKTTFSKIWVNRLLWVAVVDIQLPFILAFLGRENIAEKLAITQGFVIYITTIVLYDEFGRHSSTYTYTSNIDGVLEEKGWI